MADMPSLSATSDVPYSGKRGAPVRPVSDAAAKLIREAVLDLAPGIIEQGVADMRTQIVERAIDRIDMDELAECMAQRQPRANYFGGQAQVGRLGSDAIDFIPDGTGAVTRSAQAKMREIASVKDFGAVGSGGADDTAAINLAIAWLNGGQFRALYFPPGNYTIRSALTTIQQSDVAIYGAGLDVARITVAATVSPATLGTVFTIGDDTQSAIGRISIRGLGISFSNTPSPSANPFVAKNCSDIRVESVFLNNASGFVTLGSSVAAVNRFKARAIEGNYQKGATQGGYKVIEPVRAITCTFDDIILTATSPTGTGYSVYMVPPSTGFIDEIRFTNCTIWATGQSHGFYIDITNEKVVNVWVDKCVFDGNAVASFTLTSASGTKECRNVHIRDTRLETSTAAAANCVSVSHTGTGVVTGLDFENCLLSYRENKAAVITGALRDISFRACRVQDSSATAKSAALSFGTGNFSVLGCKFFKFDATGNTTSAVETTADVDDFVVQGNIATQLAGAFMTHYAYATYSANRLVAYNAGANDPQYLIGAGVPSNTIGSNGDAYIRTDGTVGANTALYHKEAGSWVAAVTT